MPRVLQAADPLRMAPSRKVHTHTHTHTHTEQEVLSGKKEGVKLLGRGKSHVETDRAAGYKVCYLVRRVNDGVFESYQPKVKNPGAQKQDPPLKFVIITITNTWKYGSAYSRMVPGSERIRTGAMTMIIPKGAGLSFGL